METVLEQERSKYGTMWEDTEYGVYSPGEKFLPYFSKMLDGPTSIIDFGCGTGRASSLLIDEGHEVTAIDFVDNCLDKDIDPDYINFKQLSLWSDLSSISKAEWGYCCDVMEHIPVQYSMLVLRNIMSLCDKAFFNISFSEDHFGKKIRETLHVTVMPFDWWKSHLSEYGIIEAIDMLNEGIFIVGR